MTPSLSFVILHPVCVVKVDAILMKLRAAEPKEHKVGAASVGAGDADSEQLHNERLTKVYKWIARSQTAFQLIILWICTKILDELTYLLFGHQHNKP